MSASIALNMQDVPEMCHAVKIKPVPVRLLTTTASDGLRLPAQLQGPLAQ